MTINITRVDKSLPLPEYQTSGAVAFDLYSRIDVTIKPKNIELIPTNLIVEVPEGYMLMIAARSSTPIKKGLVIKNGVGIIDQDYHGPEDELRMQVFNFTDNHVEIKQADRLAQGILVKIAKAEFEEVDKDDGASRGGFGSTGY